MVTPRVADVIQAVPGRHDNSGLWVSSVANVFCQLRGKGRCVHSGGRFLFLTNSGTNKKQRQKYFF